MFSGMLLIFLPLIIGYLIPVSRPSVLEFINTQTSRLVLVILALMGLSLAGLDNLSQNLSQILTYTVVFFVLISGSNMLVLPLIDRFFPIPTEHEHQRVPFREMMMESVKLIFVVAGGLIAGLLAGIDLSWVDQASEIILLILLFLIGIQLRNSGMT